MRSGKASRAARISAATATLAVLTLPAAAAAERTAYVSGRASETVAALDIGTDGTLTALAGSPDPVSGAQGVAVTPDGAHVYVAGVTGGNIGVVGKFNVAADGSLSPAPGVPAQNGANALFGVAIAPDGQRLYVTKENTGVRGYTIAGNGSLSLIGGASVATTSPGGLAITPDGKHLYTTEGNAANNIRGFNIATDGSLSPVPGGGLFNSGGTFAGPTVVSPSGGFLYVSNVSSNTISVMAIQGNGTLDPVGAPVPTPLITFPAPLAIAPDGKRLYVGAGNANFIGGFDVAPDGTLALQAGSPYPSQIPSALAFTPGGSSLYSSNALATTASGFNIDSAGALTAIAGSPFQTGVANAQNQSIAISPNQGPTATFTANPLPAGFPSVLDATASSDTDGTVTGFAWDFGDGTTLVNGNPSPSHTYAAPGTYTVSVTVTDNEGCSTAFIFTGQTASCNGGAKATSSQQVVVSDATAPSLALFGKRKQKLDGTVEVGARCSEACTVEARGTLVVSTSKRSEGGKAATAKGASRSFPIKPRSLTLEAEANGTLKLAVKGKGRTKAMQALVKGGRVVARITVTAGDGAGNRTESKRRINLTARPSKRR